MKKGFIILIILVTGILFAAGVGQFTKINLIYDSGSTVYFNQLSTGKSDSLFFRLSDELTSYQLYPFPDSTVTEITGTDYEVNVIGTPSAGYVVGLPDDVTITSDLTVSGNIYQGDSDYHYFGDDNNMRAYHDGTQGHIEPAYVVTNPDALQILFSNSDSIFTADGDIKDWSGNRYDAELDSSYCLSADGTTNDFDFPAMTGENLLSGASAFSIEFVAESDWVSDGGAYLIVAEWGYLGNLRVYVRESTKQMYIFSRSDATDFSAMSSDIAVAATGAHKYKVTINIAADSVSFYRDDTFIWGEARPYTSTTFNPISEVSLNTYLRTTISAVEGLDGKFSGLKLYKDGVVVFNVPCAEGSGAYVYDTETGATGTISGATWDTQGFFHYNLTYGFTSDSGIYYAYDLDGNPTSLSGTNHPAGNYHNGAETQICFNPNDIASIITATGFTSSDFFTYAEIVDFMGTGTGDFTVQEMSGTKYDMTTFAGSVQLPDAGFLATGKLHDPDAQLSNKSRGITNATKNAEFLNNSSDTLLVVYDDGAVAVPDSLHTGIITSDSFPDSTITDITGTANKVTVFGSGGKDYSISLPDSVDINILSVNTFYPMAVAGKMIEENETGSVITCTVADTFYQWVTMDSLHSANGSQGIAYEDSTHSLIVPYTGRYLINAAAAISLDATGTVHMGFAKNGTIGTYGKTHYEFKFANQDISMAGIQSPSLTAGDKLSLWFSSDGTDDITLFHVSFIVTWLGQ